MGYIVQPVIRAMSSMSTYSVSYDYWLRPSSKIGIGCRLLGVVMCVRAAPALL